MFPSSTQFSQLPRLLQSSMRFGPKMAQKLLRSPALRLLHETIETLRSLPPRGIQDVRIRLGREGHRGMAQERGDLCYPYPRLQSEGCEGVPQCVEPIRGQTRQVAHSFVKALHGAGGEGATVGTGED